MNNIIDSGTRQKTGFAPSIYSIRGEEEKGYLWIQPSISHTALSFADITINEIYVGTKPQDMSTLIGGDLGSEFLAWEMASDEAISRFEDNLD